MNKNDRDIILKFLDENKIDELRTYLDDSVNSRYINNVRRYINGLINNRCTKKYPSYYARTKLGKGVEKSYAGVYIECENGFIISDHPSTAFELYNKHILTENMKLILERSKVVGEIGIKEKSMKKLVSIFSSLDSKNCKAISSLIKDDKTITAWPCDKSDPVTVPFSQYVEGKRILGEGVNEFITADGMALFLTSPNGKALIMKKR